jgi:hypothetical protein
MDSMSKTLQCDGFSDVTDGFDQELDMNTLALETFTGDWHAIVEAVQASGEPVVLALDGMVCGLLLPTQEAHRVLARYIGASTRPASSPVPTGPDNARDYLELLRDDPSLVPMVDGEQLEFVTMMNSSYVDPEQIYQFKHPQTHQLYLYRASELRQAIGRMFTNVDFIPVRPKDFVEGKQ